MNKFLLSALLLLSFSLPSQAQTAFKKVATCDSDYFNGTFCSKKNLQRYQTVLKSQAANFNGHYILLNTGSADSLELIALDTKTGIGYPLNYQFTGWEDNDGNVLKKPSYSHSLQDEKVCLAGSQYDGEHPGTHETYSNIKNCFSLKPYGKGLAFESTYTDKVQYQYDEKSKTWRPYD